MLELSFAAFCTGDVTTAQAHGAEALRLRRESGGARGLATALTALAWVEQQDDLARAEALGLEAPPRPRRPAVRRPPGVAGPALVTAIPCNLPAFARTVAAAGTAVPQPTLPELIRQAVGHC